MPIVKAKLSKSAWVLIALLIVAIIALPLLHFVGVIDLSFIGDGFQAILIWASDSALNGVLFTGGVFVGGMLTWYAVKKYLIGTKVPLAGAYAPIGQTISQPQQQQEETVVSE